MRKCPKCKSDVENNFDTCWNCNYSFDGEIDLNKMNSQYNASQNENGTKNIECLRCKVQLKYQGNFKFHEGTRVGAFGNLFELFTNRESFDLYCCPKCGKVEFFLPD